MAAELNSNTSAGEENSLAAIPEKPDTKLTETSFAPTKKSRVRDCTEEYLARGIVGFQMLQLDEPGPDFRNTNPRQ